MTTLLQTQAFHRIPPANIQAIFMRMQRMNCRDGEIIIQQGAEGDYFYAIVSGKCLVTRETPLNRGGLKLAELGVGDTFGEEALISEAKRNATVTMMTDGVLMRLNKKDFRELMNEPLVQWVDLPRGARGGRARRPLAGRAAAVRAPEPRHRGSLNVPLYFIRLKISTLDRAPQLCGLLRHRPAQLRGGLHPGGARLRCLRAARRPGQRRGRDCAARPELHRVRGLIARERAGQVILDLVARLAPVLVGELHADAGGALALCTLGSDPDHAPGDRQFLVLPHEIQQHEHLIAEAVVAAGRNEQAAVLDERHVGQIQARSCP